MQFSFKESLNLFKNGSADLIGKPVMYQQMIFNINKIIILPWLNKKVQNLYGKLFLASVCVSFNFIFILDVYFWNTYIRTRSLERSMPKEIFFATIRKAKFITHLS